MESVLSARSCVRFVVGSRSHMTGTQITKKTISRSPQPWSFWNSGVSRSDGIGLERSLLREVRRGFPEPHDRHPDHEEDDQQKPPALELLEQRRLQIGWNRS